MSLYDDILKGWQTGAYATQTTPEPASWSLMPFQGAGALKDYINERNNTSVGMPVSASGTPAAVATGAQPSPVVPSVFSGNTISVPQSTIQVPTQLTRETMTSAPAQNLANMGDISKLANAINQLNIQAQQAANAARIPGAAGLEQKSSSNIESALAGELPADVIYQIAQNAAQRGVATGAPGGANTSAAYLRALGLNSLDLQKQGQDMLTQAYARNPAAPIFDIASQLMTPAQAAQVDISLQQLANQLYGTQLDDETKKALTLQSLAQQLYLGQMDDATKRWMAQLSADTQMQIQKLANAARFASAGGGGGNTYYMGNQGSGVPSSLFSSGAGSTGTQGVIPGNTSTYFDNGTTSVAPYAHLPGMTYLDDPLGIYNSPATTPEDLFPGFGAVNPQYVAPGDFNYGL